MGQVGSAIETVIEFSPLVGTVYDAGKSLGCTAAAGVIAIGGGDPHGALDCARDAGIGAGVGLVADVATVATGGAASVAARGAAGALRGGARVAVTASERAAIAAAEATARAEAAAAMAAEQAAIREAEQAAARAAAQRLAEQTALREAAERAAAEEAALITQRAAEREAAKAAEEAAAKAVAREAEVSAAKAAEKAAAKAELKAAAKAERAAADAKLTRAQKLWKAAKPTKLDVAVATGIGIGMNVMMHEDQPDGGYSSLAPDHPSDHPNDGSQRPVAGVEDQREPQLQPDVDLYALLLSQNVGMRTPVDIQQKIKSVNYQRMLQNEVSGDYSWMVVPLVVTVGMLLVSEA